MCVSCEVWHAGGDAPLWQEAGKNLGRAEFAGSGVVAAGGGVGL